MKRLLILVTLLATTTFVAHAQYESASALNGVNYYERQGWSIAASLSGGDAITSSYEWQAGMDVGLYADGGYHFNPWFYLGATLGVNYVKIYDQTSHYKSITGQFMINPRVYILPGPTSPFIDIRGGVNLWPPFYGRLEALVGCLILGHFEVAVGVANTHYAAFDSPFDSELRTCYRAGYRFYF